MSDTTEIQPTQDEINIGVTMWNRRPFMRCWILTKSGEECQYRLGVRSPTHMIKRGWSLFELKKG